jgi:hypothetical protein
MTAQRKHSFNVSCCYDLIIVIYCLYVSVIGYIWLRIDTNPAWGFGIPALRQGLQWFYACQEGGLIAILKNYISLDDSYPPLLRSIYFVFYSLFGPECNLEMMVNALFLVLGIVGVYKTGQVLFNKFTGLIAAVIWSAFPSVLSFSKSGYFEFPLMCTFALMIFLWVKADLFRSRRWSIFFGIACAAMIAIKPQGILFGVVPFAHFILHAIDQIRSKGRCLGNQFLNAMITVFTIIAVGFHWYLINATKLLSNFIYRYSTLTDAQLTKQPPMVQGDFSISFKDVLFYIRNFYSSGKVSMWVVGIFCVTVLIAGCLFCRRKYRTKTVKGIMYLMTFLLVPIGVYSILNVKAHEHLLVILPVVALIAVSGGVLARNGVHQSCITILVIVYGLTAYGLSLGFPVSSNMVAKGISQISRGKIDMYDIFGAYYIAERQGWRPALVHAIKSIKADYTPELNNPCRKARMFPLVSADSFNDFYPFLYYNDQVNDPLDIIYPEYEFFRHPLDFYDYIVMTRPFSLSTENELERTKKKVVDFIASDQAFKESFEILSVIPGAGKFDLVIYKKRVELQ